MSPLDCPNVEETRNPMQTFTGRNAHIYCSVVDLPGIYSIRPYTNEEIVTRDFILNEKPDGIINIVDATNIERNLYLTLHSGNAHSDGVSTQYDG